MDAYDVFLSFRGEDTRKNFVDHLYTALEKKGIHTFRDEEALVKGRRIDERLWAAIEGSTVCIPILSKAYADSSWCLRELSKMVSCNKTILPVFYHVDPSDVRKQKGCFKEAFRGHRERFEETTVSEWREALRRVAEISGFDVNKVADGHEAKLIQLIVRWVLEKLNCRTPDTHEHLVGIGRSIDDLMGILNLEANDVRVIVIRGVGGIGKTTLATTILGEISDRFDAAGFVSDIREASKQPNGLVTLQKLLISEILKEENLQFNQLSRGKEIMRRRFRNMKVLVVLDDVAHAEQLAALAGNLDWFGTGSRIMITTRDENVLNLYKDKKHVIYKVKELSLDDSLRLLSYHAFGRNHPPEHLMELVTSIASATGGLPLVIKVIGSLMFDKETSEDWNDLLDKFNQVPPSEVLCRLKVSYDTLDDQEKTIFLDIACFFVGVDIDKATYAWENSGLSPRLVLKSLIQKSLIKIDETGKLQMNCQIRDLGRQIAQDGKSLECCKRLWVRDEVLDVLCEKKGTGEIEGISLDLEGAKENSDFTEENFSGLCNLRLLRANFAKFKGNFKKMPRELRWLEWHGWPSTSLPDDFNLQKLSVLNLSQSQIVRLWKSENKTFQSTKILDLSYCCKLQSSPDLSCFPVLEKLVLRGCRGLSLVHESLGTLKKLLMLDLSECDSLTTVPICISGLNNLIDLKLSNTGIEELPDFIGAMNKLKSLELVGCQKLRCLAPDSVRSSSELEYLDLSGCGLLKTLPHNIGSAKHLSVLDLAHSGIEKLPDSIGSLENLKVLQLAGCKKLFRLPESIGCLGMLEEIDLSNCESLIGLPDSIGNAKNLRVLDVALTNIEEIPSTICSLENLRVLQLAECKKLRQLNSNTLMNMTLLEKVDLSGCDSLQNLPDSIGQWKSLTLLDLANTRIEELPHSASSLERLKTLVLAGCRRLRRLPSDFFIGMTMLENLDLSDCDLLTNLPDSIGSAHGLLVLDLANTNIEQLPESVCSLAKLKVLQLAGCGRLRTLPDSIGRLVSLERLDLTECTSLKRLPRSFGNLEKLEVLDLSDTKIEEITETVRSLENVKIFGGN